MKEAPSNVSFRDLQKVCEAFFGKPRHSSGSHFVYKTPWIGNPRVNIQSTQGKAKCYQVKQVLQAIEMIERH
jgi:hypothetical protein